MQRLIMSINPGRSGSNYLAVLLDTAKNISAFHEPSPTMAGRYVKLFPAKNPSLISRLLYPLIYLRKMKKVTAIKKTLKIIPSGNFYAEMTHMFILSFYDVVMKHFPDVQVIHLRRNMAKVMKSYIDTNNFAPGFHDVEKKVNGLGGEINQTKFWCVSPNSQSAAIEALARDTEIDQYDLCVAYLIEIEARAQRFRKQYRHVRVIEVAIESLNEMENIASFFEELGAEISPETELVVGKIKNKKSQMKSKLGISVSENYCRERINQYIEKCKSKGITLPPLPHL